MYPYTRCLLLAVGSLMCTHPRSKACTWPSLLSPKFARPSSRSGSSSGPAEKLDMRSTKSSSCRLPPALLEQLAGIGSNISVMLLISLVLEVPLQHSPYDRTDACGPFWTRSAWNSLASSRMLASCACRDMDETFLLLFRTTIRRHRPSTSRQPCPFERDVQEEREAPSPSNLMSWSDLHVSPERLRWC